jgi:septal ring factor EnvC (AmiA/AmiB activator)
VRRMALISILAYAAQFYFYRGNCLIKQSGARRFQLSTGVHSRGVPFCNFKGKGMETSNDLLNLRNDLTEEMRDAMQSGDGAAFIRISETIKGLEPRILAAELTDLQAKIETNVNRRDEIKVEIETLYKERAKRQSIVAEAVDLYNRAQTEVAKVDFGLEMLNIELQSISVSNREMRQKIDSLKDAKMKEVIKNERYS